MATIVQDTFDRADNPSSLGTADTGQVWSTVLGTYGIESNQGVRFGAGGSGRAVIDSGFTDAITKVTLVNPESLSTAAGQMGLIFRWVDENYFWSLTYERFFGGLDRLRMKRTYAGSTFTAVDVGVTITNGQTISVAYCGPLFTVYVDDVEQATYDDSLEPQNYGTQCGLRGFGGTLGPGGNNYFDNFLVTTNGTCTPTYNCTIDGCVDPGDGTGAYATLAACLTACVIAVSYNCVDGACIDPGDGSGTFATLLECELSGCTPRAAETQKFDAGNGSEYYLIAQLDDDGDELRSKTYKAIRATGIRTNASAMMYGYDVQQEINVEDLEAGTRSNTRMTTQPQTFTDSEGVTQSERKPINVANAVLGTVRYEGDDTGNEQRDRIDEIVIERAIQGVRR